MKNLIQFFKYNSIEIIFVLFFMNLLGLLLYSFFVFYNRKTMNRGI